ncbi:MAG: ABC transporter substrate-binding protein [Pseudomonadota bacterium]
MKKMACKCAFVLAGLSALYSTVASAEVNTVSFAHQNGWAYTTLYVMQEQHLVEKQAKLAGIELKADYKNLGSPGVIRDALIAKQVQFGAVGIPTLITLADKTNREYQAVGNIVSLPMYLNTTEQVKSVCDIKGKIALPTIKTSVQAVTLQMAAKQQCGNALALDSKTVSMTHPDGMASLLNGQVAAHFTSPPFQYVELEESQGKVKRLLNSYDVLGGKTSFIVLVGSNSFRQENPKAFIAVTKAFEEAQNWISSHRAEAAALYVKSEKPRESVADVTKQMASPEVLFDVTPNRIGVYARFMHEIGTVKHSLSWQELTMPNLHTKSGS